MTAAERKKLEEEAIKRQKSTSPASSFRKKMEGEALKKQKELAARKVGTDFPATVADERTEAPTSIIGRINADIVKGREAEQTKQTLIRREKAEQSKAIRQNKALKLSDINRSAAPVDYTKESAEAKNRFLQETPTLGMSPLEKLEYNARKYNPLALGDMAINQAAAGAGRFAASVSDAVIAPFKGKGIVYPALQTTQELWNADEGKEPSALDKYIGNAKATLRTFKNAGRDYYLGGGTLQGKADKYSLEMSERYADITDNAVTRAMSDLAQSAGYMIPAQLANAIIPNAGTALLFVSGYSSGERQALQEGATPQDARNYALLNGLNQSAGEMLIGGVLGQGAGVLDGLFKKAGLDVASKITDPKLLRLVKGLTSALGEGAEEVIQGLIDVQAKRMTYDKGAKADPAGLAYEGLLGSLLGAGSNASAAILNAQNDTMSLPSPLPITEQKNAENTPNIDADISAKQAELSARLKTADEEALYRRLTAAKTDTEKSGILAGASDEAVAAAARFADKGGMEIAFIREDAVNGVVKDGFTKGGKIYINAASDKTAATIITHELLHNLEQTDGYAAFKDYVGKHVNLTADAEALASLYRRGGLELTPMEIESEALAKYAEKLFESEDDIYNLVRTDRTLGQKILDWINSMITKLTGTAEEKYLLRAKELYSKALTEARRSGAVAGKAAASVSEDAKARIKYIVEKDESFSNAYRSRINDKLRSRGITDDEIKSVGLDVLDNQEYWASPRDIIQIMEDYDPNYDEKTEKKKLAQKKLSEQPNEDSEGNAISLKQKRYFTDSVVREIEDNGGNYWDVENDSKLLPVYHATYKDFTVFDKKLLGNATSGNTDNENLIDMARIGFWFSSKDLSTYRKDERSYVAYPGSKAIKSYINITKPMVYNAVYELADSIGESGGPKRYLSELKSDGYDGIIVKHDAEMGGTSFVVFEPNQIKEVANVAPTNKKDIRYSISKTEDDAYMTAVESGDTETAQKMVDEAAQKSGAKTIEALEKENKALRELNDYQRKQFKRSDRKEAEPKAVAKYIKGLLKSYSSKTSFDDIQKKLADLYIYIANGDENGAPGWETAYEQARDIADDILQGSEVLLNGDLLETYSDIKNYFRRKKFFVPAESKAEFGDYKNFRNKNFGKFILTTNPAGGGYSVDASYAEMTELFGEGYFPSEITNPTDQLQHISHVLEGMGAIYANPFSGQAFDEVTAIVASDILDKFYDIPQRQPTFADRASKELTLAKVEARNRLETLRESKNARIELIRSELKAKTEKRLSDIRLQRDKAIEQLKASFRKRVEKSIESRSMTAMRGTIKALTGKMAAALRKPDKKIHVADKMRPMVADLFEMIAESPDMIDSEGNVKADALRAKLAKVSKWYSQNVNTAGSTMIFDPNLQNMFDKAEADLEGKAVRQLNVDELTNLAKLVKAVYMAIRTENKMFAAGSKDRVDDIAGQVRAENLPLEDVSLVDGESKTIVKEFANSLTDPQSFFERLGPTMLKLFKNIAYTGQDKYITISKDTVDFMKNTLKGIDRSAWDGKDADIITVNLSSGQAEFTPDMVMSVYLLSKRPQGLQHMLAEGISLKPPGAKKPSKGMRITQEDINHILENMDSDMKRVADAMGKYVTETMSALGNEVSLEAYGYSKFLEKNYWKIYVYDGTLTKEYGQTGGEVTLANNGSTKSTIENATNPVVIESAVDTFDKHATWMAAYRAYVLPLMDMSRVLNSKTEQSNTTVRGLLEEKHGAQIGEYLDEFFKLVNSGKLSANLWNDKLSSKMLRGFKGAAVGLNMSVVAKQPISIIRAADMINMKYLRQAVTKVYTPSARKAALKEMLDRNPIAMIKDWGYADMGFGKNLRQLYDDSAMTVSDKMAEISGYLPSMADKLTWLRIWEAVKLEQAAKGEMSPGWAENRFKDVIFQTQVVNTIFSTPPILNSNSLFTKMTTSFMAEPLKTFNMLVDSIKTGNKKTIARTASVLIANQFVVSLITVAFQHFRKKEDDEESAATAVATDMLTSAAGMVPIMRDIVSLIQGYDILRTDMTGVTKIIDAVRGAATDAGRLSSGEDPSGTPIFHIKNLVSAIADTFGIPVTSVMRDLESATRNFASLTGNIDMEFLVNSVYYNPSYDSNKKVYYDLLSKYSDDDENFDKLKNKLIKDYGYTEDAIEVGIRNRLKKSDEYLAIYDPLQAKITASVQNKYFAKLPEAEQKEVIKNIGTYATSVSLAKVDPTYKMSSWSENVSKAVAGGLTAGEYLLFSAAKRKADTDKSGSYSNIEKINALRDLNWLNVNKREILFRSMTETDGESKAADGMEAIMKTGVSFDKFLDMYQKYTEIGAEEDLSASQQALQFANWVDERFVPKQSDIIQEHFGFWSGAKAAPTYYNNFTDAGMDIDTAYDLADAISKLDPAEGKKAVTSLQRYRVVADAEISDKDKLRALSALMPEAGYKALRKAKLQGLKIDSYVKYLEGTVGIVSDIINGEPISGSRKQKVLTYINRMLIPKAHKDLLYYIAGYSENTISDAPWHGGTPYSGNINGKKVNGRVLRPLKSNSGA